MEGPLGMSPERIPVIVGVGQVNDRPDNLDTALDSAGLMIRAIENADRDGGGNWAAAIDTLSIVRQISCPDIADLGSVVAKGVGAQPREIAITETASGDGPILLLNRAANQIAAGEAKVVAVTGGEALRTAAQRRKADAEGKMSSGDIVRGASTRVASDLRQRYGLNAPVDVYPLYENAIRAAFGQTLSEAQAETGAIWSRFAGTAAANPDAWLRNGATADEIVTVSPANRLISFPYTKLMVANSAVNQGAGFIVTSQAEAARRGVPPERLIHVGRGAAAHEASDPLVRANYSESPSMTVSITEALRRNGVAASDLDHVEFYSCFPCIPKMARRILGWPLDKPASLVGGLTFGGGPIGNYMSHAVAAAVDALRQRGRYALLFANGGLATHNHTIVLSSQPMPDAGLPDDFDVQDFANAQRGPLPPVIEHYEGAAKIETFMVPVSRDGSLGSATIVARTSSGARTVAHAADAATLALLTDGRFEPVGTSGMIQRQGDDQIWTRAITA